EHPRELVLGHLVVRRIGVDVAHRRVRVFLVEGGDVPRDHLPQRGGERIVVGARRRRTEDREPQERDRGRPGTSVHSAPSTPHSRTLWPRWRMQLLKARWKLSSARDACWAPRPIPPAAAPAAAPRPGLPSAAPIAAPPAAPTRPPITAPRAACPGALPDAWRARVRHCSVSRLTYWARELP